MATIEQELAEAFDPDEAPEEIKALAERIYFGLHPALLAVGVPYASAERVIRAQLVQKATRLHAFLDDEAQVNVVLNILFDR